MASGGEVAVTISDPAGGASSVTIRISRELTGEELKKRYANEVGQSKPWRGYKLTYGSTTLEDTAKISASLGLASAATLKVTFQEPPLVVNVRGLDGRTKKITAYENWTVRRLKEEYAYWLGQGWDNVVMLYKAKRLKDTDLLSVYKIETEGFIQANVRSVGGSDSELNEE